MLSIYNYQPASSALPAKAPAHTFKPLSKTKIDVLSFRTTVQPRFGCRLFGYISVSPEKAQGEMLEQLSWKSENSLKTQSEIPPEHELAPRDWEGMITKSRLLENIKTGLQNQGCGQLYFNEIQDIHGQARTEISSYKSTQSFSEDPVIRKELKQLVKNPPNALMLHLREASSSTGKIEIRKENGHPFQLKNFAMMHNGTLSPNTVRWLEKKVAGYHQKFPDDIPLPKGSADSERFFLYLMGRLREECGTLDSEKIGTADIEKIFQQALNSLLFMNQKPQHTYKMALTPMLEPLTGVKVREGSETLFPYGMTIILSDGKRMFLSRSGRNLHFATMQGDDGKAKAAFVTTMPMQPHPESNAQQLQWWTIPEAHLVTLERNQEAQTLEYKIQPFGALRPTRLNELLWKAISWMQR